MKIGVLSLQGNFAMHLACLNKLNVKAVELRNPAIMKELSGLILREENLQQSYVYWVKIVNCFLLLRPLIEQVIEYLVHVPG